MTAIKAKKLEQRRKQAWMVDKKALGYL